jgi:hypothetical protein
MVSKKNLFEKITIKHILFTGLFVRLLAVFFSPGYAFHDDHFEMQELASIYVARGLTPELAMQVAQQLAAHDTLGAHARDELGMSEAVSARPLQAALTSAATFAAGAALPLLTPGGLLIASSNHQKLDLADYLKELRRGSLKAGSELRVISLSGQPEDFPYPVTFPEGRYLKYAICVKGGEQG